MRDIPLIDPSIDLSAAAFVHPTASLYGDVRVGEGVSVWPYVAVRCETGITEIGAMTNIGMPGKVRRTQNNAVANRLNAWMYHRNALGYAKGDYRVWDSAALREEMKVVRLEFERELAER
jgi:hypothetical protein